MIIFRDLPYEISLLIDDWKNQEFKAHVKYLENHLKYPQRRIVGDPRAEAHYRIGRHNISIFWDDEFLVVDHGWFFRPEAFWIVHQSRR